MRAGKQKTSRGVSLVEAMVALAVMAFGMLAVVGVQSTLRLNADIAKQRSEATRIAQENLEHSRAFAVIETADAAPGQTAWEEIVNGTFTVTPETSNTTYTVQRVVATYADPPAKALNVTVTWNDRSGQQQELKLSTAIAAAAPALSGTLNVRPGTAAVGTVRRPFKRHPTIPVQARDFGSSDGRSGFVLPNHPRIAFLFNNITGVITGVCDLSQDRSNSTLEPSDVASCSVVVGQLLSGFVRFQLSGNDPPLTAAQVENPVGPALNVALQINLTSTHPQSPRCFDDVTAAVASSGNKQFATYFCVIYANDSLVWSGTSLVNPDDTTWRIDSVVAADAYRVCRYTPATSEGQTVPNQDHPRQYVNVSGNLTNQNFVVIRSANQCPTDGPADPLNGNLINSNTLQHQPAPAP
jgi:Tfp pilus assembly protein PilV